MRQNRKVETQSSVKLGHVRAALIFLGTLAVLFALKTLGAEPPVHRDTVRDFLMARDCVEGIHCHMRGPASSFLGFHGALWIHVLELAQLIGLSVIGTQFLVLMLQAAAASIVYLIAKNQLNSGFPGLTAVLYCIASIYAANYPLLWNPSLLPLPAALFYYCLFTAVMNKRVVSWLTAAFYLGLTIEAHPTGVLLLGPFLGLIAAVSRAPLRTIAGALGIICSTLLINSWRTAYENARLVSSQTRLVMLLIASSAIVVAIGWLARRRIAREFGSHHLAVIAALMAVFAIGSMTIGQFATGHQFNPRYSALVLPLVAILAIQLVLAISRLAAALVPARRVQKYLAYALSFTAVSVLAWPTLLKPTLRSALCQPETTWRLAETEILARHLYAKGWTWTSLATHVHGPQVRDLVSALGLFEPSSGRPMDNGCWSTGPLEKDDQLRPMLFVMRANRKSLPRPLAGWGTISVGNNIVAIVREVQPYLDYQHVQMCIRLNGEAELGSHGKCFTTNMTERVVWPGEAKFASRANDRPEPLYDMLPPWQIRKRYEYRVVYTFKVNMPARGSSHVLDIKAWGWSVVQAENLSYAGALPASRIRIDKQNNRASPGQITISTTLPADAYAVPRRLEMLEIEAEDENLLQLLQHNAPQTCPPWLSL